MENKKNIKITNDHGRWQVRVHGIVEYETNYESTAKIVAASIDDLEAGIELGNKMGDAIVGTINGVHTSMRYILPSKLNNMEDKS